MLCSRLTVSLLVCTPLATAAPQVFESNPSALPSGSPANFSDSEEIDFADVDRDGDFDAAVANGGDLIPQQNRLWIDQGGLQAGALGVYLDETAGRLPVLSDMSRDVEFADIDGDQDPDLYVADHSSIINSASRWLVNGGGLQGGTLGFFTDQTASRWVGLGGPGSSIPPGQVLPSGGFIDWSSDGDFADFDLDGDLDLLHSSYGNAFSGTVPSRIFLNDGLGFFTEFNPSGVQLAGTSLPNGTAALWAEGLQQSNTADTSGQFADVTSAVTDLELIDFDGDRDLDILLGNRNGQPRYFSNRLVETGTLGFRDLTAQVLPAAGLSGQPKYDQFLADFDGDLDLDLLGVNWGTPFLELVLTHVAGALINPEALPGSSTDDEAADPLDYDNDGDLDAYVGNFAGADHLYDNGPGGAAFGFTQVPTAVAGLGATTVTVRDVEVHDADQDGDYDLFLAAGSGNQVNLYLENHTEVADVHAPTLVSVAQLGAAPSATGSRSVELSLLDNAALYVTAQSAQVELLVTVDGVPLFAQPATTRGGQVFGAALPANLTGTVAYTVQAADAYGNGTTAGPFAYLASPNPSQTFGSGTPGSLGVPQLLVGSLGFAGHELWLAAHDLAPGTPGFLAVAATALPTPLNFGDGLVLNVLDPLLLVPGAAGANGVQTLAATVPPGLSGFTLFAQYVGLGGSGATFASSAGVTLPLP
jgi:hypothetical protein